MNTHRIFRFHCLRYLQPWPSGHSHTFSVLLHSPISHLYPRAMLFSSVLYSGVWWISFSDKLLFLSCSFRALLCIIIQHGVMAHSVGYGGLRSAGRQLKQSSGSSRVMMDLRCTEMFSWTSENLWWHQIKYGDRKTGRYWTMEVSLLKILKRCSVLPSQLTSRDDLFWRTKFVILTTSLSRAMLN